MRRLEHCCPGAGESLPGWCTRQRQRQTSREAGHPLLAVLLAVVFAVLGVVASLSHSIEEDPKLALARQIPVVVGTLIDSVATSATHARH